MTTLKKNPVLWIALAVAVLTSFLVPPDRAYLSYFDCKTLTCLFCTLAVICALKNIHFFRILAERIVCFFKTTRSAVIALVYITFLGSMLIANDMALITFLPLGYYVLTSSHQEEHLSFTFIMQNIAANLGGMLTPFGNPQNLYLYSFFQIPTGEFVRIMLPSFLVSILLITLCCLKIPKSPLELKEEVPYSLHKKRTAAYLLLFALAITIVFRAIPYYWGLILIPSALLLLDRSALKKVDYPLLLTFCAFFVFAGNMARIPVVNHFLSALLEKDVLLFSTLSCQVISNVPSAILLSKFTTDYAPLLIGVNIGGTGTLIASLASLITFREFGKHHPEKIFLYLKQFFFYNLLFLTILLLFTKGCLAFFG